MNKYDDRNPGDLIAALENDPGTQPGTASHIETTADGTEYEDTGITKPFNPTLINITTKQMSLDTLIKRIQEGEVDLAPDFQRAEVWKPTAKSRLIESLLIRFPCQLSTWTPPTRITGLWSMGSRGSPLSGILSSKKL